MRKKLSRRQPRHRKNSYRYKNTNFNFIKQVFNLTWLTSLTIGGVIIILYLGSETIFPRGITLGDSFLLAYTTAAFGFIMLAGIIYGAALSYWFICLIVWLANRNKKESQEKIKIHAAIESRLFIVISLSLNILVALIFYTKFSEIDHKTAFTISYFFMVGLFLLMLFGTTKNKSSNFIFKLSIFVMLTLGSIVTIKPMLLDLTMSAIGVRSWQGQLVTMSNKDQSKVLAIAKQHGLSIKFCNIIGTDLQGTKDVQVIWQHIGDISYIQVKDNNEKYLTIPLSKEVETYPSKNTLISCQ